MVDVLPCFFNDTAPFMPYNGNYAVTKLWGALPISTDIVSYGLFASKTKLTNLYNIDFRKINSTKKQKMPSVQVELAITGQCSVY